MGYPLRSWEEGVPRKGKTKEVCRHREAKIGWWGVWGDRVEGDKAGQQAGASCTKVLWEKHSFRKP